MRTWLPIGAVDLLVDDWNKLASVSRMLLLDFGECSCKEVLSEKQIDRVQ
jgi:hypothetical protein